MVNTHGMIPADQIENTKLVEYSRRAAAYLLKLG